MREGYSIERLTEMVNMADHDLVWELVGFGTDSFRALATQAINAEGRVKALEARGKHLCVKLADVYRAAHADPKQCQAVREWLALFAPQQEEASHG